MTKIILVIDSATYLLDVLKRIPNVEVTTLEPGLTGKSPDRVVLDEIHEHVLKMNQEPELPVFTKITPIDRPYGKKYRRTLHR